MKVPTLKLSFFPALSLGISLAAPASPSSVPSKSDDHSTPVEAHAAFYAEKKSELRTETKAEVPFWRRSSERLAQIREGRSIQVSSQLEDLAGGEMRFTFHGAGDVTRACSFTHRIAQQFERLSDVSDVFQNVVHDISRGQVFLTAAALKYRGQLLMNIDLVPASNAETNSPENLHANSQADLPTVMLSNASLGESARLRFEVVWGAFKGLKGELTFDAIEPLKCEVSVVALYRTAHAPIPKALFGFALEVLIQKMAGRMRSIAEHATDESLRAYAAPAKNQTLEEVMKREKIPLELLHSITAASKTDIQPSVETPPPAVPRSLKTF